MPSGIFNIAAVGEATTADDKTAATKAVTAGPGGPADGTAESTVREGAERPAREEAGPVECVLAARAVCEPAGDSAATAAGTAGVETVGAEMETVVGTLATTAGRAAGSAGGFTPRAAIATVRLKELNVKNG